MSNEIIFKTFKTYRQFYVYDRHTNAIVILSESEYDELQKVEKGELDYNQSSVIQKYKASGMFTPNVVKAIQHPATEIIEEYLQTRMKQLTLQVTQQCNLRCGYCAYSGIYEKNRTHSNQVMDLKTALKAIDFFLARNVELSDVVIGFYGGEPLLEFELIQKCVEYAKNLTEGRRLRFNMTTNGTLLTDSVIDFLVDNDFALSISLDGSKQEHDTNRKFANGNGSFDVIISNIERIQHRYPKYYEEIMILTTVNPLMDLSCALEFFSTKEIFSDRQIIFNSMNALSSDEELPYDESYFRIRNFEHIKTLLTLVGKLEKEYVSPLAINSRGRVEQSQKRISDHAEMASIAHHSGPCLPGIQRLFIRVDGTLFPCERVNEMLDYFKIGTIDDGVNIDNIKRILNIGDVTEADCKNCWGLRQCSMCAGQVDFNDVPTRELKLKGCHKSQDKVLSEIYELSVLNEFGFDIEELRLV